MFTEFFYLLRGYGLKVSLIEWNDLMAALERDLNGAGFEEFYYMSRAILVKKESEYDKFDQAFLEYFKRVNDSGKLPPELAEWLAKTMSQTGLDRDEADAVWGGRSLEEIRAILRRRLAEQKDAHYGGNKWVGTGGATAFGHTGYAPKGIRVYGQRGGGRALKAAGRREFRDFREDKVLQTRQFQVALRKLRLLSDLGDARKTELDVDGTIRETCDKGGQLEIVMKRPRRNQTKLLLLMDSGGSMWAFAELCSRLFQAVNRGSQFKSLKIYYFHNCFYGELFKTPKCLWEDRVDTEKTLKNLNRDYKVILVGDAAMGPAELLEPGGGLDEEHPNQRPGLDWLRELKKRFPAAVWLNPMHERLWDWDSTMRTVGMVREIFPMYPLTVQGLDRAVKELQRLGI